MRKPVSFCNYGANCAKLFAFHAQKFAKKFGAKIVQILCNKYSHFVETLVHQLFKELGMETFLTKNGTRIELLTKITKNGMECTVLQLRTPRTERLEKKGQEQNDLAEGPCSRAELND